MIQDIAPHVLRNQYIPGKEINDASRIFFFRGYDLLTRDLGEACFELPMRGEFGAEGQYIYLFTVDEQDYFLLRGEAEAPEGCSFVNIRALRQRFLAPRELVFAAYTAWQLCRWYRDNAFCGTCGGRTVLSDTERAIVCPDCGRIIYPRIIPAVIVGVTNGDEIVLTRYANRPFKYNALVAGFTEIGETFEDTVHREVREELGLNVKNIRYYKSQPWAVVDDLLAGFYCDVDGDPTIHLDDGELASGIWTRREDIELQPDDFSLTNEMMLTFKLGKEPR